MSPELQAQLALLPDALAGHLVISVIPIMVAVLLSVPLGVAATSRPWLRGPLLASVSLIQTVPGLALLALMVPLLVAVGEVLEPIGITVQAIGAPPVLIALTLYAMLPVVRNTVAGIEGLDPGLLEAAHAIGMTPRQVRLQVELPLAAPVILAGVRTAAVWTVGMGTLATPVGQTSMGNFIFAGLQTRNVLPVLVGCLGAAALALVVDGVLAVVERAVAQRRQNVALGALGGLAALVGVGVAGPELARDRGAGPQIDVGTKVFTEQYILGALLQSELDAAGFAVSRTDGLGSAVIWDALVQGEIDVYVDYSGTIWANFMKRTDTAPPHVVEASVCEWVQQHGVRCVGNLGFENAYALAVRAADARERGWSTVADLVPVTPELVVAGDYEFFQRPEWAAVRDAYGLRFREERTFDVTFVYEAAANRQVDVISAYTTDGRIAAFDLETLEDPKNALPPYDALVLVGPNAPAGTAEALAPLIDAISIKTMREANRRVDMDGASPTAAADWLRESIRSRNQP